MNYIFSLRKQTIHCILCNDAPCTNACKKIDVANILRSLRFQNINGAIYHTPQEIECATCDKRCEVSCLKHDLVPISKIIQSLNKEKQKQEDSKITSSNVSLKTDICGVPLENPFLLSSSVVASNYDMCARAFEMGWAGAVFKTICCFPIHEASPRFSAPHTIDGLFRGFKNIEQLSVHSLEENLETFRRLKKDYPTKVLVASIMGRTEEEWSYLAKVVTQAGVDVIECNFSCPNMMDTTLGSDVGQSPELVEKYTKAVKSATNIPILAKMTPNLASMIPPAIASKKGGAVGIAAINTIKSICEISLETYATRPSVNGKSAVGGYSGKAVKPIALRFIAELTRCKELNDMHISGMGGVYTWEDAAEFILLGCKSIQITTAVMEFGYRIIDDLIEGLQFYLSAKGMKSIQELVGLSCNNIVETSELERDTILFPKFNLDECIGCGRCYLSCRDGGHNAIEFDAQNRKPKLNGKKCVGCHLCVLVCPNIAITSASKRIKNI